MGPHDSPKSIYTNNSLEFIEACEELNWNHGSLLRSEKKEIAERAARRVQEGTSAGLAQSRLAKNFVGLKHGGLLISPKHPRPTGRWPDTL